VTTVPCTRRREAVTRTAAELPRSRRAGAASSARLASRLPPSALGELSLRRRSGVAEARGRYRAGVDESDGATVAVRAHPRAQAGPGLVDRPGLTPNGQRFVANPLRTGWRERAGPACMALTSARWAPLPTRRNCATSRSLSAARSSWAAPFRLNRTRDRRSRAVPDPAWKSRSRLAPGATDRIDADLRPRPRGPAPLLGSSPSYGRKSLQSPLLVAAAIGRKWIAPSRTSSSVRSTSLARGGPVSNETP
jgi:hypothetical protein